MEGLVTLREFILTLSKQRKNRHESLGAFVYWIEKDGCPRKWPFVKWEQKFEEFLHRKV
jgi:hypothetical protein